MSTASPLVREYPVPGVSCGHCVAAITAEVGPVPGVDAVEVSLDDKVVRVTGSADPSAVVAAIEEAGYDVVASEG